MNSEASTPSLSSTILTGSDEDHTIGNVIKAVILVIIFVLSATGNFTVLYIIAKNYQMRTVTNALVVSLSVSDLITTCLCMPITFISLIMDSWPFGEIFCIVNGSLATLSGVASIVMVTLIAVDRLVSVLKAPGGRLSSNQAAIALTSVWACSCLSSMPWYLVGWPGEDNPVIYQEGFHHCMYLFHVKSSKLGLAYSSVIIALCFCVPYVIMTYCFCAILRTIRSTEKQIRPAATPAQNLIFSDEVRTAVTVMIMISLFALCWLPYIVISLLELTANIRTTPTVDAVALLLTWSNRAMNPFLYAVRNPAVLEVLNIKSQSGYLARSFTNIQMTPRPEPEQNGNVVSEDNVKPRFDWAVVKRSPLSPRFLFCGDRKGSDQDVLERKDSVKQSTSL